MSAKRWFIVTNTENLEFFFHCGLVVDKQGIPEKAYIADALCKAPVGYLPCYPEDNLWGALQAATSEDENLAECLLEVDVKQITTSAFCRTEELENGSYQPFSIEGEINSDTQKLTEVLLPAPLPFSCIKNIILKDAGTKKSVESKYKNTFGGSNGKFITSKAALFKKPKQAESDWVSQSENESAVALPAEDAVLPRELDYNKAFSYGGALSLLYYQTKNGRQSTQVFKGFSTNNIDPENHKNIAPLSDVFGKSEVASELSQLYRQVIHCVFGRGNVDEARYDILQLLKDECLPAGYVSECEGIAKSLTRLVERTHPDDSDTIFEKIIKHYEAKEPGRSKIFILLTMFFVRDHSETMLKYYHQNFTEEDYCLLALFFGSVNGFINTPPVIRGIHGLATWVSFKMAEYLHRHDQAVRAGISEPTSPFLVYDKCFKSSTTNVKLHDFYEWFGGAILEANGAFVEWIQNEEYVQTNKGQVFKGRPKTKAMIVFDKLEELIMLKTVKDSNDLFDFNPVIDAFKKKS